MSDALYQQAAKVAAKHGFVKPFSVYLAGPDVFLPNAVEVGQAKKAFCAAHGLLGIYPFDNEIDFKKYKPREAAFAISQGNEAFMHQADAIIANATPWHGPSLDVGTAFEIGYMRALGKPVFVYSNDARDFFNRVSIHFNGQVARDGKYYRDTKHLTALENFKLHDNLMIEGAVDASGGKFTCDSTDHPLQDLSVFKRLVRHVEQHFYNPKN